MLSRARHAQIAVVSRLLLALVEVRAAERIFSILRANRWVEEALVGYRRAFGSKEDVERYAKRFSSPGHSHPGNIEQHVRYARQARASDYPALFHLRQVLPKVSTIVDIGGSTGNLFYCYRQYLDFPEDLKWIVFDTAAQRARGAEMAAARGEMRLAFTSDLDSCPSADLVLISGALHFFEEPPPRLLAAWEKQPEYILINRSPVSTEAPVYGIQHQGDWVTTAKVLNRGDLLASMTEAGYELVDEWAAPELALTFPLHPRNSVKAYSGFLFRLCRPERGRELDGREPLEELLKTGLQVVV